MTTTLSRPGLAQGDLFARYADGKMEASRRRQERFETYLLNLWKQHRPREEPEGSNRLEKVWTAYRWVASGALRSKVFRTSRSRPRALSDNIAVSKVIDSCSADNDASAYTPASAPALEVRTAPRVVREKTDCGSASAAPDLRRWERLARLTMEPERRRARYAERQGNIVPTSTFFTPSTREVGDGLLFTAPNASRISAVRRDMIRRHLADDFFELLLTPDTLWGPGPNVKRQRQDRTEATK